MLVITDLDSVHAEEAAVEGDAENEDKNSKDKTGAFLHDDSRRCCYLQRDAQAVVA